MLKPAGQEDPPQPERPVGDIVHELIEDGKAYARAELGIAKAVAAAKAKALALPAGLLGAALLLAIAAVTILAMGLFVVLARPLGPMLGALATFLVFAGLAAGLAWYAVERLRRDL